MMKIVAAILLVVACVHANSTHRYGWAPGTESVFRFESQVLTGIPDIRNSQYAGLKIMATVRVQAFADYTLRIKMEQPRFVTLNGEISLTEARRIIATGGSKSGAKEQLPQEFLQQLEEPVLVHLKRGMVENFFVSRDESVAVTNIKRSVLSQLQLDVSGSQRVESAVSQMFHNQQAYHKTVEESVLGKCHTMYNIIPMTQTRVMELERAWLAEERAAQLTPSEEGKKACDGKTYYEIIKTRDLDHCHYNPTFQHVAGADFSGDASKSHVGTIQTHMASSTTYVCGDLSNFNIRKIVVDDTHVSNPMGYNTEQVERTYARIMMELVKKEAISQNLEVPSQTRKETSLVYAYPEQIAARNHMSADVVQQTEKILATVPVLPQPSLTEAPRTLIPLGMSHQEIITKVTAQFKAVAREVYQSPESCTSKLDISGKLLRISKYMQVLSLNELEEVWTQALADTTEENKKAAKYLLIDTLAMVGTNPATMLVLKKIDAAEICFIKATATIQTAMKSIRTPTKELAREFIRMVRKWKNDSNAEKRRLLAPTLLQLSNLFYRAYVNPSTMVSNYPVRIYGIFGTKDSRVLVDEYIPMLKQILQESEHAQAQNEQEMKPVIIAALGKLGHLDAAKALIRVAQGIKREEPMLRSLAVYSMKRIAKRYPTEMKAVLLAIVNNPAEHADVRIAAVAVLPWAQPSFAELQKIAVRSWYETSNQLSSFARSTFESLLHTEVAELKPMAMKVRGVLHMFKPTHYGLQFSKNVHVSNFVQYLLSSVSTNVAFTATKDAYTPSRFAFNSELLMQTLGEGFKQNIMSYAIYSQGMETAIDHALNLRAIAGDLMKSNSQVINELKKIASEINLVARNAPAYKAFVMSRNMGYEYAYQLTSTSFFDMIDKITAGNYVDNLKRGVATDFVAAANLFSIEVQRPTVAGIPMIARQDMPSVLAGKASLKYEEGQARTIRASLIPIWNVKYQSDNGIVSPFTEEHIGHGVTMAFHASVPAKAVITVKRGELEVVVKTPEEVLNKARRVEVIHGFVMPYTVRSSLRSVEPFNKANDLVEIVTCTPLKKYTKQFDGLLNGEFRYESDNEFIDFYSYWEKIRQNNLNSLPYIFPLMSSVRKSSARIALNPAMSELKEVALKIKLWAQKPNQLVEMISKPFQQAVEQELSSFAALKKAIAELRGAPATIIKVEASIKEASTVKKAEAFLVAGYKPHSAHHVKSVAAAAVKAGSNPNAYGVLYEGELKKPKINARWNKEQLLQQPLEMKYNGELLYGANSEIEQGQRKIVLKSVLSKTQEQIRSVQESDEFKKCALQANAGRRLSPICIKVRHQAGSLDRAQVSLKFPQEIYRTTVMSMIEEFVKANFIAHYRQVLPAPQMPQGEIKLDMWFPRAGDVAQVKVEHQKDAWKLENLRIPYKIQGVLPVCARNNIGDWIEQKATNNYAPASCRIEPEIVSTFDNKTYAYKINDCEHVLMLDGARKIPVGVLAKTITGEQKMVTILAGETKVEIVPVSSTLKVKLNGREQAIAAGATFVEKSSKSGDVIAEIKHYQDGVYYVYVPAQFLHVLTDGKSVEIVAPQILKARSVGLCGDLNGEEVADVQSPRKCVMRPRFAAMSYMLNKEPASASSSSARCGGIPTQYLQEYKREEQECIRERIVPTPIIPIFERLRTFRSPLVSAHKVEKQRNQICISKEKIKTCGGQSGSSPQGMSGSLTMKHKMVKYSCVSAPSSKAQSLERRAKSGETLGSELAVLSTAYTKMEAEPMHCGASGSTGSMSSGIGGGNGESDFYSGNEGSEFSSGHGGSGYSSGNGDAMYSSGSYESGPSSVNGGYGSSSGNGDAMYSSGSHGSWQSSMNGGSGSSHGNGGSRPSSGNGGSGVSSGHGQSRFSSGNGGSWQSSGNAGSDVSSSSQGMW